MIRTTTTASAVHERAIFFAGQGSTSVAGVLTSPSRRPVGVGVVVLSGGGFVGSTHRNALTTRICRELAGLGFHAVRFDWHGVGDSSGTVDRFRLDHPFVDDVVGSVAELASVGVDRLLFFGSCFGARTALAAATVVPGVEAMLLVAPPVRRPRSDHAAAQLAADWGLREVVSRGLRPSVLWGLRNADRRRTIVRFAKAKVGAAAKAPSAATGNENERASGMFARSVRAALDQGIDITFMYGAGDAYYQDLSRDQELVDGLLTRSNVRIETVPGELHGYQRVQAQELVLDRVRTWGADWVGRLGDAEGGVRC